MKNLRVRATTVAIFSVLALAVLLAVTPSDKLRLFAPRLSNTGTVPEAALSIANNTTGDVSTSAHGFAPKGTVGTTQFWRQDWTLAAPSGAGTVTNTGTLAANQLIKGNGTSDITVGDLTGDVTTSGTMATTLANSGVSAGSYASLVTFDAKGRATAAAQNYLLYQDQETQNTAGGTFTSGAWRTRVLNTEVSDVGGFGTLASNQITLAAGTYLISAIAPAYGVSRHQLRLQNVTDATTLVIGQGMFTNTAIALEGVASLRGIFTVAASKALELQHQGQVTQSTNGFGVESNFTTEVYAVVELWKIG